MTNNIIKGLNFWLSNLEVGRKYIDLKKTKGKNAWDCLKEQNEETHEPPSSEIGEVEEVVHEEDQNSLPNYFQKYEETSHEKEEVYLETIEYHYETNSNMDMDQRASTDGCLNYEGVPTDGCSQLYIGDIEIRFQNVS